MKYLKFILLFFIFIIISPLSTYAGTPPPSVAIWYPTWDTTNAWSSLQNNIDVIDEVSPVWYSLETDGTIYTDPIGEDKNFIDYVHNHKSKIIPLIGNAFDPVRTHNVITNPTLKTRHIGDITRIVVGNNYDGFDIDYENLYASDRNAFTAFISELASSLHQQGKILTIAVHAKTYEPGDWPGAQAEDWAALGAAVDRFRIMTYDYSYYFSGPIAPYQWVSDVINFAKTKVDSSKIVMGIPYYGYDWKINGGGNPGTGLSWLEVQNLINLYSPTLNWSETFLGKLSRERWFEYKIGTDNHQVWFSNHESLPYRLDLVNSLGIKGIAIWRLGSEDPDNWRVIRDKFPDNVPPNFSNIKINNLGFDKASISWQTDEESTTQIEYGLTINYGSSISDNNLSLLHQVQLTSLQPYSIYHLRLQGSDRRGNSRLSGDNIFATYPGEKGLRRIHGQDRYGTAVEISKTGWATAEKIILVRGDDFPDALSGAPLSQIYNAPILLTRPKSLPRNTAGEINRLGAKEVFILGSEEAISPQVEDDLRFQNGIEKTNIHRLGGKDRYETSEIIARQLIHDSKQSPKIVIIATGLDFPDALSGTSLANLTGSPLLLTNNSSSSIGSIKNFIKENGIKKAVLLGERDVVSDSLENNLKPELESIIRLAGEDRYKTSLKIVLYGMNQNMSLIKTYISTGEDFPDSFVAAALAAKSRSPLLLTRKNLLPEEIRQFIFNNKSAVFQINIIGGPNAVSDTAERQLAE